MNFSVRFSTSNSLRRQAFVSGAPNPPVISRSGPPGEQEMAITSAPGSTKQVSHSVTPSLLGGSRSASSPREVVVVPNSLAAPRSGYSENQRTKSGWICEANSEHPRILAHMHHLCPVQQKPGRHANRLRPRPFTLGSLRQPRDGVAPCDYTMLPARYMYPL